MKKGKRVSNMTQHSVYHIFPTVKYSGKVGATANPPYRVEVQQGAELGKEAEILFTSTCVVAVSDEEIRLQDLFGYPKDQLTYTEICMKKVISPVKFTISRNKDWYSNYDFSLKFARELVIEKAITIDGVEYTDADFLSKFAKLLQSSRWDGCYASARAVDKLIEEFDGNAEMTAAHKLWLGGDKLPNKRDEYLKTAKRVFGALPPNDIHFGDAATGWCGTPEFWKDGEREINVLEKRQQNKCSDLNVGSHISQDLDKLMLMQKLLQQEFPSTSEIGSDDTTLAEVAAMAQRNWHAFTDEYCEFMDAIGGINDGIGNGAWKYWKADHKKAQELTLGDLSEEDLKELQMEVVDMLHFFMNFALMVGMSGSDLFNLYVAKNKENFDRQDRGY